MKGKIYLLFSIVLLGFTSILIYKSYQSEIGNSQSIKKINSFDQKMQEKWVNRKLVFPLESVSLLDNRTLRDFLGSFDKEKPLIISFFDAGCSQCVADLNTWSKYLKLLSDKNYGFEIIFIAKANHLANIKYQVIDLANFKYPVFFDKEGEFLKLNNIPDIKAYQTFLLERNQIKYIGSPIQGELFSKQLEKKLVQ